MAMQGDQLRDAQGDRRGAGRVQQHEIGAETAQETGVSPPRGHLDEHVVATTDGVGEHRFEGRLLGQDHPLDAFGPPRLDRHLASSLGQSDIRIEIVTPCTARISRRGSVHHR